MQNFIKSFVFIFLTTLLSTVNFYSQNLITNGDFGIFNAAIFSPAPLGYTTTYTQIPYNGAVTNPAGGVYAVTNNPGPLNIAFIPTTDHTTSDGLGNMLFVDGRFNRVFWKQDPLVLQAGVSYLFTFWIKNIGNKPTIGPPITKFNPVGCTSCSVQTESPLLDNFWTKRQYTITPTITQSVSIELSSVQSSAGDNFVIDDISLTPPIVPMTASFVKKDPSCPTVNGGSIVAYVNSGTPSYTYNLTGTITDTNSTGVFTGLGPGSYEVEVIDSGIVPVPIKSSIINLVAPTDMTLTSSATVCVAPNAAVTLTASNGVAPYTWTASTGVAIPSTAAIPPAVTPAINTTYTVTSSRIIPNTNLITNGDFESSNSGFYSDFVYTPLSASLTQFDYGIVTNPNLWNSAFISNISPRGKMFITKGATVSNKTIWSQTVLVDNSKSYTFEFYAQNAVATSPAQFRVLINGVQIGIAPLAATNAGSPGWTRISGTWNSGLATTAKIQIINTNIALPGNDFAIDDIAFFTAAPPKSCLLSKTVDVKVSVTSNFANPPAFCSGSPAPLLSSTSPNGIVGTWSPATVSNTASGSYIFLPTAALDDCAIGQSLTTTVTSVTNAGTLGGMQNVCIGLDTTFSSTVSGGTWTSSNNAIATVNPTTGVVTGVAAGTATITYTITGTGGCPNDAKTRNALVTVPPTAATLNGTQDVCVGLTTAFTSNIAGGTWSSGNTAIATVDSSTGVVTGVTGGTAIITYTILGTGGCANVPSTRSVTVTAAPIAATLGGTPNVCVGLTTAFTSNIAGGTWSSGNTAIATVDSSTGVVTGVAVGTVTITYTITGTGGCPNVPSTRSVTVTTAPNAGTLSGDTNVCVGLTTAFSSTVTGGTWSSSDVTIATVDASSGVVTGVAAGTATITYTITGTGGCLNDAKTRNALVTVPPTAATLNGTQDVCVGLTTAFTSNIAGGTWSSGNTAIATVDSSTGFVTGVAAGTVTITYTITGTGGCPNVPSTRSVTVTTAPNAGTLSGDTNVCVGLTTAFSSTVTGGTWSSSDVTIATVDASSGVVTGVAAGTATITYTITGTGGCPNDAKTRNALVTVPPTAATLNGTQDVCVGLTTAFTSNIAGGTWSSGNTAIATVDSSTGFVTGVAAGTVTITYTITGTGGCPNVPSTRSVTVTTAPNAGTLSGDTNVCVGLTTAFSSTVTGGTWSSSDVTIATVDVSSGVVTGVAAGTATITYTITGTGGCPNDAKTRNALVTVPPTAATLNGTQDVCVGLTTAFTSNIAGGTWSSGNTAIATVDSSTGVVTGVAAGTVTITYTITGTGGCPNVPSTRSVTVTTAPNAGTLSGDTNVCVGLTTAFSSTVTGGTWSSSDVTIATVDASSGVVTGVAAGTATITYTITGTGGCPNDAKTRNALVTVPPTAATLNGTQDVCVGLTTAFTSNIAGGTWSSGNTAIATVDSSTGFVTGVAAGTVTITYTITGTGGCPNVPSTRSVTVTTAPNAGTLSGDTNVCVGLTTAFSSTVTGGTWNSSDVTIATVDASSGVVTGVAAGTAIINYEVIGTCQNTTETRIVTVTAAPIAGTLSGTQNVCVALKTIFSSTSLGGVWSSSDTSIATIDAATGEITGFAAGNGTMTYTMLGTGGCADDTETRNVTVTGAPIAGTLDGLQAICVGFTTTFSSTEPLGTWSSSDTAIATVDSLTGFITGVAAGSSTITYTVLGTGGCPDATETRIVTVTAAPIAGTLSGNTNVCVALKTTFSSTSLGGVWSSSDTSIATIDAATGEITGVAAGNGTMTYTMLGTGGCADDTETRNVTVTGAPIAGTLDGLQAICVGFTTTFSSTEPLGTWSSSDTAIATVDSLTGFITGVAAGSSTITYTVLGTGGCPDATETRIVTVTAAPIAGTLSGNTNVCVALKTTFSSTSLGGVWSSSDTSIATIDAATGEITGVAAGNGTMTYTMLGTGGCADDTETRNVTVTGAPIAGTLDGLQAICVGFTTTFSSTEPLGTWSSSDTAIATVDSLTGFITGVAAGSSTITYTVLGTGGCPDATETRIVTVTAAPIAGTLSGNTNVCVALKTTFSSTSLGGVWSSSDTSIATIDAATGEITGVAAGNGTMTYTMLGTGGCADDTETRNVTVTGAPIAGTLDGLQAICVGFTTTFSSTEPLGTWSSSDTAIATVDSLTGFITGVAAGSSTITYTVLGTGGCPDATETRIVTVTAAPIAGTLSGNTNVCVALKTTFSSTSLGGVWSSSDTSIATIDAATGEITGVAAGNTLMTYTMFGTGGCVGVDDFETRSITVDAEPNAGILDGKQNICVGSNTTFTTNSLEIGLWSSDDTNVATVNPANGDIVAGIPGTATITYTVNGSGACSPAKANLVITVTGIPNPGNITGVTNICNNATTIFTTDAIDKTGTWSSSIPSFATVDSNGEITGVAPGISVITYTLSAVGGCDAVDASKSITIDPIVVPTFDSFPDRCANDNTTISPLVLTSNNGITGTWSPSLDTSNITTLPIVKTYDFNPTAGLCASTFQSNVTILPLPIATATPNGQTVCSDVAPNISLSSSLPSGTVTTFAWDVIPTEVIGDSSASGNTIDQKLTVTGFTAGKAVYTVIPSSGGCLGLPIEVTVNVNPAPEVNITSNLKPLLCSGEATDIQYDSKVAGTTFSWTVVPKGVTDAFSSNGNAISQALKTTGIAQGSVDYIITPISNTCTGPQETVTITVNPTPEIFGPTQSTKICSGETTNITLSPSIPGTQFNWTVLRTDVTGGKDSDTSIDGVISETLIAETNVGTAKYTIIPTLNSCPGESTDVSIQVNPLPKPVLENGIICVDQVTKTTFKSYILDSGLSNTNHTFKWFFNDAPTPIPGANSRSYEVTEKGKYSVIATNKNTGCPSTIVDAEVIENLPATEDDIQVSVSDAFSENPIITVDVTGLGTGPFLYQLDYSAPQSSNVFNIPKSGEFTVTVTDEQGCTNEIRKVIFIDYPKFFTPNGDGINDTWRIGALPNTNVNIYDRYGKLIKEINASGSGWDGTLNGQLLPGTDYWFTVEYIEPNSGVKKLFKSHFSLKR